MDAPARLQMGLLDLRGDLGRLFGGIGVALREPRTVVEAVAAPELAVDGTDAERAGQVAARVLERWRLRGAAVRVERAIPAHAGLGSGTQLALAVAAAIAEAHGLPRELPRLAAATGRATRSGVGSWTFEGGGLVVDGGHAVARVGPDARGFRGGFTSLPPLLVRRRMPPTWRCVVAIPRAAPGMSGRGEREAFERLPPPAPELVGEISHVVLLGILPAVAEEDLRAFGRAVTRLQELVGDSFAPVQGARFASPATADLVARLREAGAAGAGQSSWGPAVYGFVDGDAAAARLATLASDWIGGGAVFATSFDDDGARVRRAAAPAARARG